MISLLFQKKAWLLAVFFALLLPSTALWAQDADLDPSFLTGSGFSGFSGSDVNAIAIQDDGKIIVGGSFGDYNGSFVGRIARLNPDGTLDASFNTGTGFSDQVKTVALQADGKIIVGGDFFGFNGATYNRLVRLNANGSVDNTFAVSVEGGSVEDVEIQSDGKIVIGGSFTSISGQNARKIARLNSNGSLDSVFSGSSDFSFGVVRDLELQSDGKIVACGTFSQLQGGTATNIARLNANGTFDASFNTGTAFNSDVTSIALQSDGKIVVGGFFTQYNGSSVNRIARLNTNGSLDGTFNVGSGFNGIVSVVEIQSDGKILVGGLDFTTYNGSNAVRIARLLTNGALDSNFNSGSGFDIFVFSIALQTDGKILVGGQFSSYNGQFKPSLVRLKGTSAIGQPSCNAGILPSDTTALCTSAFFSFDVVGSDIPEGFFYGLLFEPGAGASGGFGEASYITDVPLSLSFNGDLNGLFSGNGLPPFSGPWSITGVVYSDPNDVAGSVCATSNSVVVVYLDCDCQGVEGGDAFVDGCGTCVAGTTGLEPCDATCWSPTVSMQSPDNINYTYSNAAGWSVPVGYHADILAQAVVYVDGVNGSTLGCNAPSNDLTGKIAVIERGGCAFSVKVYNAQQAGAVAVIVVNNVPGNEIFQMGGGDFAELITIPAVMIGNTDGTALIASVQNGPVELFIGNSCVPVPCEAGSITSQNDNEICPDEFYSFEVDGVTVPAGANYALLYQPGPTGTGALGGGFYITVPSLPYSFDADINGVLSSNSLPSLVGEWFVSGVVYTDPAAITASICSSTAASVALNFLDASAAPCQTVVQGCTDSSACNFNAAATDDDGSCTFAEPFLDCAGACLNDTDGDGVCNELEVPGCQDSSACNFNAAATDDDGSCTFAGPFLDCAGACLNDIDGDGVCDELEVEGCTYPLALNYNPSVATDDGSCLFGGCTDPNALNYTSLATVDDGSCNFDGGGTCPSDLNGDGLVNATDLTFFLSDFGTFCD